VRTDPGRAATLYRTLVHAAPNAILGVDERGRITLVNPQAEFLFGYGAHELLGERVELLVPERVRSGHPGLRAAFGRHPANRPMGQGRDLCARRKDGTEFPVEISLGAGRTPDGELLVQAVVVDITDRKRAEAEHERRAARQAALAGLGERALEGLAPDVLMVDAVAIASEGLAAPLARVLEYEGDRGELRLRAAVGFPPELVGTAVGDEDAFAGHALQAGRPVVMEDERFLQGMLEEHGAAGGASVTIGRREAPFGVLGVHTASARTFSPDDLNFLQAVANVLSDAVDRHRWEERMRHEALHDPLTGLPNRTLLVERLRHWAASRERALAAVVFVDLDHFKFVNDTLGHEAGDELLRAIGPRLRAAVRAGDTVARFGGDEFVVLCERVESEADAVEVARRVEGALTAPFALRGKEFVVSPSLGVAAAVPGDVTPEEFLRSADEAMYRAKKLGRARLVVFDAEMDLRLRERLELEAELRRAVALNAFAVRYQPVVELGSERLTGFEALVRWPRGEVTVTPDQFIPLAEETGLIRPLGRWVLEQACRQAAQWRERFPGSGGLSVSVNLSAQQVVEPGLAGRVRATLAETGLPPQALRLEITETVLLDDAEIVRAQLEALHALGVRLVLDDFGTGYSSLSHIKRHPIDTIKIDRSFVEGIERDRDSQAIAGAIVQMAEGLRMQVIAEGVSEPAQAEALARLGCRFAQGFLYAPPLDVAGAERALAATR